MIRREFGATTLRRSAINQSNNTRRVVLHHSTGGSPAAVASLDALSTAATHDAAPAGRRAGYSDPTAAAPFFKLAD